MYFNFLDNNLPSSSKSSPQLLTVGTGDTLTTNTFDISKLVKSYNSLNLYNFHFVTVLSMTRKDGSGRVTGGDISYDSTSGILTVPYEYYGVAASAGSTDYRVYNSYTIYVQY